MSGSMQLGSATLPVGCSRNAVGDKGREHRRSQLQVLWKPTEKWQPGTDNKESYDTQIPPSSEVSPKPA